MFQAPVASNGRESTSNGLLITRSGSPKEEDTKKAFPISVKKEDRSSWPEKRESDHKQMPPAQRPVILSSSPRRGIDSDVGCADHRPAERDQGLVRGVICLSSKSKDLSLYKRDYFVPSARDETLNGLDERVSFPHLYSSTTASPISSPVSRFPPLRLL